MASISALSAVSAITLQVLRLSVDLIKVASTAATSTGENDNASSDNNNNSNTNGSNSNSNDNNNSNSNTTDDNTAPEKTASEPTESSNQQDALSQPLLSASDVENAVPAPSSDGDNNQEADGNNANNVLSNATRFGMFLWAWSGVMFLITLVFFKRHSHLIVYPKSLLLGTVIMMKLETICHCLDTDRLRYGIFPKTFRLTSLVILWSAFLSHLVNFYRSSSSTNPRWYNVNNLLLADLTLVVLFAVIDGWLANKHPTPARRKFLTDAANKPTLSPRALLTLIKPYVWPDATSESAFWNRVRAITTWFCVILSKACNLATPLLLGQASTALAHQDYMSTVKFTIGYSVLAFLGTTFKECQSLVYLKVGQAAFVQLSETAFDHLHHLSLDWHLRKKLGEVLRSMDRGILACDTLMKYLFLWLIPALMECLLVTIIFATYFRFFPMAVAVFYFAFAYIVWTIVVTLWRKKFRKALVKHDNEWHDLFTDSMINFETVKHFTAEEYEKERFRGAVSKYQVGSVNVQGSLSLLNVSQNFLFQACMATSLSLAAWGIEQRITCCTTTAGCEDAISDCCRNVSQDMCPGMEVGDFVAVLTYIINLFAPLDFLGSVYNAIVMAMIDLTNLSELLAENPDVVDAHSAVELPSTNRLEPETAVEFDDVYFHYPSQPDHKGLKGLSFKMKRGTTTAVVGPTGAGKTTIGRLLFRFYDVLGGSVKVNGVDVRSATQASLRGAMGVVPQTASLFNDTIRSNILYGRRDATEAELIQAAVDAQLYDFIQSLDEGWETMVGDRGLKLSGGEKQRAAIARCLLKDPPFVLLDEATSALDTLTEASVQEALDRLGAERTVLVIAHRLGTIRNADNIIVLKDGKVAEEGTHDDLLSKNGVYADMWNKQLKSSESL